MGLDCKNMLKKKILFICLGNICRSPAAHAIMQKMVDDERLSDKYEIDSAGIGDWHLGELPDKRMRERGAKQGYKITHLARQFNAATDFAHFDIIIVMDEKNYSNIISQTKNNIYKSKVKCIAEYFVKFKGYKEVPDPYYGGIEEFDKALDLIKDGCEGILNNLK